MRQNLYFTGVNGLLPERFDQDMKRDQLTSKTIVKAGLR